MFKAKFHKAGSDIILAACDSELSGTVLEEGGMRMELGNAFFGDLDVTEDEFRGMLVRATSANIFGPRAIGIAIDSGCVEQEAVSTISGVPYAMFFCVG